MRGLVERYATAYAEQVAAFHAGEGDSDFRLTLENTDGAVHDVLEAARLQTRIALLERMTHLRGTRPLLREGPGVRRLDDDERGRVLAAYEEYLETVPEGKRSGRSPTASRTSSARPGSASAPPACAPTTCSSRAAARPSRTTSSLSMKQAQVAAPSRIVDDERLADYFEHEGHRTAVSQQALQAHADPWVGWCELDGVGQVVKELSPYEADLDWGGVTEPDEMLPLVEHLGRATAKIHCVSDAGSGEHPLVDFEVEDADHARRSATSATRSPPSSPTSPPPTAR